ncbi:hypothetical protein FH063_005800 [Azospirillum argentinense]|uniref:Uncharacterized protein n=1 Tax=Azospirillum argentinense TaxID=2970906 RepID=A0A5B0KUQ1_9PROT|nr:hypothetical protein FH063_005800 [Azospirillum argentinense]
MLHTVQAALLRRRHRRPASRFPSPVLPQPPTGHAPSFGHMDWLDGLDGSFLPSSRPGR